MIRMIAKDLRINPLRTSLTALSMFIGIIASSPAFSSARSDATIWKRSTRDWEASHPPIAPSSTCHHR